MSEFRRDPITGSWVIIATERALRPDQFRKSSQASPSLSEIDPFAVGNETLTPKEITRVDDPENPGQWLIRVIPNGFPVLKVEGTENRRPNGIYDRMDGVGAHEVIIESTSADAGLQDLSISHLAAVIAVYRDRMRDLARDQRLVYSMLFRNDGPSAGATMRHGHSQLVALPVVPKHVQQRLKRSQQHFEFHDRSVFEDILDTEITNGERIVCANANFVCCAPYASSSPYEVTIIPRAQRARFEDITETELIPLASILKESLKRLEAVLGPFDYNFMIQTAPKTAADVPWYRWHFQLVPKLSNISGFERGTGFHINPVAPESAAKELRTITL